MEKYLAGNNEYWQKPYTADNVESFVFRVYGRILKYELGITGEKGEKLLDFGCGEGANLSYFNRLGFDVYGVDISRPAIDKCKERMPHIADHFKIVEPEASENDIFFDNVKYDVVIAIQSLYYYSPKDLEKRLFSLKNQMKPGGVLYATMMGTKCWYYENSKPCDNGMRVVNIHSPRLNANDYYVTFTETKEDLLEKFSMFKKLHIGFYDACYREDEGSDFHWIFIGQA